MFEIFFILIILIISIIIHEVAHGYAAYALGDPTARDAGRLTLNPIPHTDLLGSIVVPGALLLLQSSILFGWAKPVPYNPYNLKYGRYGEAFVAAAGSLTNIALAVFFGLLVRFGGSFFPEAALQIFLIIAFVNLFLGLLNLIPLPMLDGAKVVAALAPVSWRAWGDKLLAPITQHPFLSLLIVFLILILLLESFAKLVYILTSLITGSAPPSL